MSVLPDWNLTDGIDLPTDLPLFDCEVGKWQELLPFTSVCNKIVNCSNGRDERFCKFGLEQYDGYRMRRRNINDILGVQCLIYGDISIYFDKKCVTIQCPEGTVKCPMSYCIPVAFIEDGIEDCPNGEDEIIDFYHYTSFQMISLENLCYTTIENWGFRPQA